ncbi:MAG: hypothetical protein JNK48_13520 [Bryobacterales bacterium]|nr:hypothetical protein [Bryobacterales bacterium]
MTVLACQGAEHWKVTLEEPTGLYPRDQEVVRVPLRELGNHRDGFTVVSADGRELAWQVSDGHLLFPGKATPGERPVYSVSCCAAKSGAPFATELYARRVGMHRVEFGNSRFRIVVDLRAAAIVEAYTMAAGPMRRVNLVETSPESKAAVRDDIHAADHRPIAPVEGVEGENYGWSSPGARAMTEVEIAEAGPLRAHVRVGNAAEGWEFIWYANSASFEWRAARGFRFLSVSASPYLPFDRCVDGSEYQWPSGPGSGEPQPNGVEARGWQSPPGGHFVYYRNDDNYGALGIVPLAGDLRFAGACSRKFAARSDARAAVAVTFPPWAGVNTVLEARKQYQMLRRPLLARVTGQEAESRAASVRAAREPLRVVSAGVPTVFQPQSISLDGEWELAWAEMGAGPPREGWRKVKVPGSVHWQWLDASKIYTREAEWVSGKEWWYRRTVTVPKTFSQKNVRLQFEATDYHAEVFWDGREVGRHEGYIDPWQIAFGRVEAGEHQLAVRVWTPVHYYWKHRPYTVKGSYGAVDQKPDDITALGITRPVRLTAGDGAVLEDIAVDTRLLTDQRAQVIVDVSAGEGLVEVTLAPRNFASAARYQMTGVAGRFVITVDNPQLWWTWDHGRPNLYTLEVRLLNGERKAVDGRSMAVGIREVEKVGWDFYLNRKRMFVRGTNYYHNLFLAEMSRERYGRDLELMLGMNVNMIRLHCHFANREFYELADERGVLIWQDFLEAWYPHDRAFSLRAAALYDNHIRYVRNHASVALWAASDEEDWENYRDLTKHLAARAAFLDPQQRPAIRSTGRFGDSHIYHGWYDGTLWDYTKVDQAFISELGATLLPNYETLVKFMGDKWPIREHEEEWVWRRLQIAEAMRAWGDPGKATMQEYIPRTQAYVARLFQIAIERMRQRKKQGAGGILHFHAIDIWPSVTMAAIDFERRPTKVWDTVRRSFAPVAATFRYDRDRWKQGEEFTSGLWAINDQWKEVKGRVEWRIVNARGTVESKGGYALALGADDARELGTVRWRCTAPGEYQLQAAVYSADGREVASNVFEFSVAP